MSDQYQRVLDGGDLEEIVKLVPAKRILMHFGDPEHFAYRARVCIEKDRDKSSEEEPKASSYKIPTRTSLPRTADQRRSWIVEFCDLNGKELPAGFETRNDRQINGMYRGMVDHYKIDKSAITPSDPWLD